MPQKTNGKQRTSEKRGRSESEEIGNSPAKDATFLAIHEPAQPIPTRHVSFTSMANRPSPLSARMPPSQQAGPSRPTSGPLMVESILEEEALERKGE